VETELANHARFSVEYRIRHANGQLRASINLGNPILAKKDPATGLPVGVSVDLARALAQKLQDTWKRLGAKVDVQVFDSTDLEQNVIRPRKYDSLLFGEVVDRVEDLFAFWHSSERNDPGDLLCAKG
jgi:ABC-type amino acid transport substrate-binding protein